jgi:hypothetical protein
MHNKHAGIAHAPPRRVISHAKKQIPKRRLIPAPGHLGLSFRKVTCAKKVSFADRPAFWPEIFEVPQKASIRSAFSLSSLARARGRDVHSTHTTRHNSTTGIPRTGGGVFVCIGAPPRLISRIRRFR